MTQLKRAALITIVMSLQLVTGRVASAAKKSSPPPAARPIPKVPAPAPAPPLPEPVVGPAGAPVPVPSHVVKPGETLASIATSVYGSAHYQLPLAELHKWPPDVRPANGTAVRIPDLKLMLLSEGFFK